MRKFLVLKGFLTAMLVLVFLGCATPQAGTANPMATVAQVAATAPALAQHLDSVYAFLVAQKAVPDHLDAATKALATLDAIAPMVQQGADALKGDNVNWVQFVIQAAITAAQIFGYVAPLL